MVMTVKQLLDQRDKHQLYRVTPQATVYEALCLMAEHNIGAVLVMEEGKLQGIFSERDYARRVVLQGRTSAGTRVGEIMTRRVLFVSPDRTINECMALMADKRIRHLPVIDDEAVVGMVSIGDVVSATIAEQNFLIDQLSHYIHS